MCKTLHMIFKRNKIHIFRMTNYSNMHKYFFIIQFICFESFNLLKLERPKIEIALVQNSKFVKRRKNASLDKSTE